MSGEEILLKAEENVNILSSTPFAERLEKSLQQSEPGKLVFLTEREQLALEIGNELMKAAESQTDYDSDEDEDPDDDGGFGADDEQSEDEGMED